MDRTIQFIILVLSLIAINIPTFFIAAFSLFSVPDETNIFSIDRLIFGLILLLGNIITIQLFIAILKNHFRGFIFGLSVAVAQIIGLYVMVMAYFTVGLIITGLSILAAIALLIKEIIQRKK